MRRKISFEPQSELSGIDQAFSEVNFLKETPSRYQESVFGEDLFELLKIDKKEIKVRLEIL
jgi:hypothetical protein